MNGSEEKEVNYERRANDRSRLSVIERDVNRMGDKLNKYIDQNIEDGKKMTLLQEFVEQAREDIKSIKEMLETFDEKFITRKEFQPIKNGFYWFIGVVMLAVLTAILSLVVFPKESASTEEMIADAVKDALSEYEVHVVE